MDDHNILEGLRSEFLGRVGEIYNVGKAMNLLATLQSAQFAIDHMQSARAFGDRDPLRTFCLEQRIPGLILELGVASGLSLRFFQEGSGQKIYGFDSFRGLPEHWRPGYEEGAFEQALAVDVEGAEIIVGLFEETLPRFAEIHAGETIGLLHVDCDLYSSTKTAFWSLRSLIRPGTVVMFDEYYNYPGWQKHEHRALLEFRDTFGCDFEYIGYSEQYQQVAIRFTTAPGSEIGPGRRMLRRLLDTRSAGTLRREPASCRFRPTRPISTPIEQLFAKLKALLRKAKARTRDTL